MVCRTVLAIEIAGSLPVPFVSDMNRTNGLAQSMTFVIVRVLATLDLVYDGRNPIPHGRQPAFG